MNDAKEKIKEIVKSYQELFPAEAKAVTEIVKQKRKNMKDQFASLTGRNASKTEGMLQRGLFEVSETLSVILHRQLTPAQYQWYTSKEGGRWFQKTFRQYSLAESV